MNFKNTFPLSISGYAFIFLLMVAGFFMSISWYALHSMENARNEIQQNNVTAADAEIQNNITKLISYISSLSEPVSQWDEIFQQLDNPSYYSYWREHRMLNTDVLPEFITSAEVFDSRGIALARVSDSHFPTKINNKAITTTIEFSNNQDELVSYLPVTRSQANIQVISGYIGLRFPFLKTLKSQTHFRYLEIDSLSIDATESEKLSLKEVNNRIKYDLKPSIEAEKLMEVVKKSVIQLATVVGILCLFFYLLMVLLLGKPLVEISEYVDRLRISDPGEFDKGKLSWFPVAELEKVRNSLNQYHQELEKAHGDLDEKNKELWKLAHHDSLTGMLNRRAFDNEWSNSKDLLGNHRVDIGLILFDVNHFKAINDSYGHQTGDEVLIAISNCVSNTLRQNENLFRIGGDEFSAIIIGTNEQDILALSQRCMDAIKLHPFADLGIKEPVRISCGIAHCQAHELEKLDNLQWQADVAVYQAKRPGVNHPVFFDESMADGSEAVFSSWISNAVYEAVSHGTGLEMHYQAIVDTHSRNTVYYESLVRIRHDNELIPPSNIFPVISLRHMENELDQAVFKKVLEDLKQSYFEAGVGISINLSAETVVHKDLLNWLTPMASYLDSHAIILEVTETSLITQLNAAVGNLKQLRKLGFKVALDDFGSGYSSLRYLTSMPVDTIKFDISLIQGMMNSRLEKLVKEMSSMLTGLDYDLVAEGIESEELLEKVSQAGFKYCQGYLFGKPHRNEPRYSEKLASKTA